MRLLLLPLFLVFLTACGGAPKQDFDSWYEEVINEPYTADVFEQED